MILRNVTAGPSLPLIGITRAEPYTFYIFSPAIKRKISGIYCPIMTDFSMACLGLLLGSVHHFPVLLILWVVVPNTSFMLLPTVYIACLCRLGKNRELETWAWLPVQSMPAINPNSSDAYWHAKCEWVRLSSFPTNASHHCTRVRWVNTCTASHWLSVNQ